jgi:hypothetical protein
MTRIDDRRIIVVREQGWKDIVLFNKQTIRALLHLQGQIGVAILDEGGVEIIGSLPSRSCHDPGLEDIIEHVERGAWKGGIDADVVLVAHNPGLGYTLLTLKCLTEDVYGEIWASRDELREVMFTSLGVLQREGWTESIRGSGIL